MQADLYTVGENTRPRPPIWFLRKQFGEMNSRIEEIQCSQSLALKTHKVAAAEDLLKLIHKRLTFFTVCSYVLYGTASLSFDNLTLHTSYRSEFFFFRMLGLVALVFVLSEWDKVRALRKRLSSTAGLAFLPAIVSQFPPMYAEEYDIGDRTKEANVYTLLELLGRPSAGSLLSVSDRQKLLRYCESADQLPSFMVNNKMWAAKIRRAVQKLETDSA